MTLEGLFSTVLQLSFYGTVGCGIILISILINYARAPRWISMILWGLVALRLIVPFQFSSAVSLFQLHNISNLSTQLESTLDYEDAYSGDYKTALEGSSEYEQAVAAGIPVTTNTDGDRIARYYERRNGRIAPAKTPYEIFLTIGARIWLAGMTLLWLWAVAAFIRLKYKLRFSIRLYKGVYETDAILSPCVVGIVRPQIYLIPDLTDQQKAHILLHEQMHIRYLDHIWKIASFVVISIHWFNPFLWFMYKIFQGELEKACDERVLARLGEDKKEDYSESLLALAAAKSWKSKKNLPTPIAFGEDNIKGRIKRILAYRKPLITVSVLVIALSVVGCGVFLTMPDTNTPEEIPYTAQDSLYTDDAPINTNSTENVTDNITDTPIDTPIDTPVDTPINGTPDEETDPAEVYEEISSNGVTYQARWDGIYRINANGREEQIYDILPGVEPQMKVFEDKLYFRTDQSYVDGALDWEYNTIRWIDLENGAVGDLSLVQENNAIQFFSLYEGLVIIRYSSPDVTDTLLLYVDGDTAYNGKAIAEMTENEWQQYGRDMAQSVLQNPCQLINISNRLANQNIACLDMDGDGISEKILLEPSQDSSNMTYRDEFDPLSYFHLQIGQDDFESRGENLSNTLWAITLDGREILLVLYEDGPSGDPYTRLYRYSNGQIIEAGGFADDIRLCEISSDGIITSGIRQDVVQTDWITMRWQLDQNGMLAEIPQDTYEFRNGNWVTLREELPLHTAVGSSVTFTVSGQKVRFLQTSADWNWVLVETEDGQQGWLHVEYFEIIELQKNVMDVFDGLYMAG